MLVSAPEESRLGIGCFITPGEPLGGRLRDRVEDFVVDEISNPPPRVEDGSYTAATVRAVNWETNRLVRGLSKALKLPPRAIFFAGTKDKRAISTQQFVFACPTAMVEDLRLENVEVSDVYPTDRPIRIGDLRGNRFCVRVRGLKADPGHVPMIAMEATRVIGETGGFLNYFGVQRFGATRPMTHHIGEFMLGGEYERAVWAYLAAPGSGERRQDSMDRRRLRREGDLKEALGYFNSEMLFERMLLGHLSRREGDFIGALKALPPNLQSMFVHACQSFLFNQAVTRRCLSGIHPGLPVEGDIVVPLGADGTPDHHDFISVTARNLRKVERKVRGGKAFVSAVVMGYEVPLADGPMGEIERAVLEENGIRPGHFILPEFPKLSSRGMRREIVAPVRDLSFSVEGSDLTLEFSLFKGTYATSLLREYMKSPRLTDY